MRHNLLLASVAVILLPIARLPSARAEGTPTTSAEVATGVPEPASPAEAPFGLTWLQSRDEVDRQATEIGPVFVTQFGDSIVASGLPKELPDLHYSVLSFGYDDRLVRVAAVGEAAEHDRTAARITARYRELAELLSERYAVVKSQTHIDPSYEGDRMALGFHNKKNAMYTEFSADGLRIELSVFAEGNRTHWRLIYEYLPAMREIERRRKQLDEDAL